MKEDDKLLNEYTNIEEKQNKAHRDYNIDLDFPQKNNCIKTKSANEEKSKYEMLLYTIIVTFLFLVLLFIFYFLNYGVYKVEVMLESKDILKPVIDTRNYKLVKLENNLEVFLISDENTTKCSASLSVGLGSFHDGSIQGLAHFTEHMLFLGSKTFPLPSTFENHLRNYLGLTNAFTEEEKTTFFFEVEWQGFTRALEIFSRMFAEPLFDKDFMEKEIEAVDSENEKNLNKDPWRENQVIKSLANPLHPYSGFSTGNRNTLTSQGLDALHSAVTNLYDKYYIPSNMKLVVLSNQNLEQLQMTVAKLFSDVRRDKIEEKLRKEQNEDKDIPFKLDSLNFPPFINKGQIIWYEKIAGGPHLDIIFTLDEISTYYTTKPLDYISYLLKFSGEGSLVDYLRKNKLSSKLEVGVLASYKEFSQYAVSVYLTEEGLSNIKSVIILVFNYINLIKASEVKQETYSELHNITSVGFRFLEKSEKYGEYLATLSSAMFSLKDEEYYNLLYYDYVHSNFNAILIKKYSSFLKSENALIVVGSLKYPSSMESILPAHIEFKSEKWYNTKYTNFPIPEEVSNAFKPYDLRTDIQFKRPK